MSNEKPNLEQVIEFLSDNGVKIKEMEERTGWDRMDFYNTRRGKNKHKQRELAQKLTEAFPEILENGIPQPKQSGELERKYFEALERENELLRQLNQRDLQEIKERLAELEKRFPT